MHHSSPPPSNQHTIALGKQPLKDHEIFIFLFPANTPSVWINSTVEATANIFNLDKQHWSRRISRPRNTFSLDKHHCFETDWLPIQVPAIKDFRVLVGIGHLISLLKVRCYQVTTFGTLKVEFGIELQN